MALQRFGRFLTFAATWMYALIVVDGISRITGSGLGCSDRWPKCNGSWIPDFTPEAAVEYVHRLLGAGIGLIFFALFVYAFRHRSSPGFRGKGGMLRYATLLLVLILLQSLLGVTIIWFEVPPVVVVAHFANALVMLAVLIVATFRTRAEAAHGRAINHELIRKNARLAHIAAALGFTVMVLGSFVANNIGAPQACEGFPLCNGSLLPSGGSLVQLHWIHRVFAFVTFLFVLYYGGKSWSSGLPRRVRASALAAAITVTLQVVVAAGLALMQLPLEMRILHLAAGAAVWATLVMWATVTRSTA